VLGREILTPDEVRMLDNKKCLVFIRGLNPVLDNKYFTPKHPRFSQSADGSGEVFAFVPRLPENLTELPYVMLTPEGLKQYEKRKEKGEPVYIDTLTYDEFMMLDDMGINKRFMELDQMQAEQEYREEAVQTELAYMPDEETERSLVAELIALKKQAQGKKIKAGALAGGKDTDGTGAGDGNAGAVASASDDDIGGSLSYRLGHLRFTPAQLSEIKRAQDEKIPESYILSYAYPENSVVKMASMRRKYGQPEHRDSKNVGAA
ncbi:MAG: type IV secretory system conjugative DNA transfer family protein, partial [Lachnospiraceae bacterium]|nr:type IV secretory system conjugative DNA transfer family protein [Lachnospiraceae bacterium]